MPFPFKPTGANVWRRDAYRWLQMSETTRPTVTLPFDADIHPTSNLRQLTPSQRLSVVAPQVKQTLDALLVDRLELTEADQWAHAGLVDEHESLEAVQSAAQARARLENRYALLCDQILALLPQLQGNAE